MPQSLFDKTIQFLQLCHTIHGPFAANFSQDVFDFLPQHRHILRPVGKIENRVREQLACCIHAQGGKNELQDSVQVWVVFVFWILRVISDPFNRVEWLLMILALLTCNSVGQNGG